MSKYVLPIQVAFTYMLTKLIFKLARVVAAAFSRGDSSDNRLALQLTLDIDAVGGKPLSDSQSGTTLQKRF